MLKQSIGLCLISAAFMWGCTEQKTVSTMLESRSLESLSAAERSALEKEVSDLILSYSDAMNALDEKAILSHVFGGPNFAYTRRGSRSNFEQFKTGTRSLTTSFTDKVSTSGPVSIDLIEPDVAVATHSFDQTLTTTAGEKRDFTGTVTWIAIKRDGKWGLIHGLSYQ